MKSRLLTLLLAMCLSTTAAAAQPKAKPRPHSAAHKPQRHPPNNHALLGKKQTGTASYYSHKLTGRKMADGTRLSPASNAAASKTLPLRSKARVRNLDNGRIAVVEIRDRGPYVKGRILDVSPSTAKQLGMGKDG